MNRVCPRVSSGAIPRLDWSGSSASARGTHTPHSDVDLAVSGDVDGVRAESIAAELNELPLPYLFEVKPFECIKLRSLREHIERVGMIICSRLT